MNEETTKKKSIFRRISFRGNFITGLFIVLPLVLSVYVFIILLNFLFGFFQIQKIADVVLKLLHLESMDIGFLKIYFNGLIVIVILCMIYLIGLFARYLFIRKMLNIVDSVLFRIPIFNKVYNALKQIANAFWGNRATVFKQVVLIEYPRKGLFTIGFLTFEAKGEIQEMTQEVVSNVFIPTTPNPTSGFLIMVPKKEIIHLKMTVEDAMKIIISGGGVAPDSPNGASSNKDLAKTRNSEDYSHEH